MWKAVILDLDGVIIDAEPLKIESYWRALSKEPYGVKLPRKEYFDWHVENCTGKSRKEVCEEILRKFALQETARERAEKIQEEERDALAQRIYEDLLANYEPRGGFTPWKAIAFDRGVIYEGELTDQVPLIEPSRRFLENLIEMGSLKAGLVTRTKRETTLGHLRRLGIPRAWFGTIICEDDVPDDLLERGANRLRKKEKADFYRFACEDLGIAPNEGIAVEDTAEGVKSARKAGMGLVVAVPTELTKGQDFIGSGADMVLPSLDPSLLKILAGTLKEIGGRP